MHGLLHLFTWTGLEGILDQYGMGFYEGFVVGRLGRFLHGGRRYFSGGFGPGGGRALEGLGRGWSWASGGGFGLCVGAVPGMRLGVWGLSGLTFSLCMDMSRGNSLHVNTWYTLG